MTEFRVQVPSAGEKTIKPGPSFCVLAFSYCCISFNADHICFFGDWFTVHAYFLLWNKGIASCCVGPNCSILQEMPLPLEEGEGRQQFNIGLLSAECLSHFAVRCHKSCKTSQLLPSLWTFLEIQNKQGQDKGRHVELLKELRSNAIWGLITVTQSESQIGNQVKEREK